MLKITVDNFKFTPDYFTKMLGCIHKWIGENNEIHDIMSLYSYSSIRENNHFFFNSHDKNILSDLKSGIVKDNSMFGNVHVSGVKYIEDNHRKDVFYSASPFHVKWANEHKLFGDPETNKIAKNILIKKANLAKIELGEFDLEFLDFAKTKLIAIHQTQNRAFLSKVKITGSPEVKKFALQVGIGNLTGCGFGFIY